MTAASLLACWERYRRADVLDRVDALLGLCCADRSATQRAAMSIGDRDRVFMQFRAALFGDRLDAVVRCPRCRAELEAAFSLRLLLSIPEAAVASVTVDVDGRTVHVGPVRHGALCAAMATDDPEGSLLEHILVDDSGAAIAVGRGMRSERHRAVIDEALDAVDPLGAIVVDLGCQACGHTWNDVLDIMAFLWYDIEGWARSTLDVVHVLASAYGWTEETILSLPEQRRRWYYDRIRS